MTETGICKHSSFPFDVPQDWKLSDSCLLGPSTPAGYDLVLDGTCSADAEMVLMEPRCFVQFVQQPGFIMTALLFSILFSCQLPIAVTYIAFFLFTFDPSSIPPQLLPLSPEALVSRLTPPAQIILDTVETLKVPPNQHENTKNRYP